MVTALCACGPSETSTASGGQGGAGASGGSGATGATGGSGGATGGTGGGTTGGSGGTGGFGGTDVGCAPLPPPSGNVIDVQPSQAADLPSIVSGAADGTTIVLAAGTYNIPSSIQITHSGITLRSATNSAQDVVIDGQYAVNENVVITASDVTIAHLTVTRAVDHPIHIYPPGAGVDVKNPRLYGVRLIDGGEQFLKVNPIVGQPGYVDNGRVECSYFELTDEGRPHVEPCCGGCYTGGIDVHSGQGWIVRFNQFRGIYCDSGLAEHAIHFWRGSRDTLVEQNVIVDCGRGIGFGLGDGGGERVYPDNPYGDPTLAHYDGIIRNNIVYGDIAGFDTGIEIAVAREPVLLHNTVIAGPGASGFFSGIDYRFPQTVTLIRNNLATKITQRDGANGQVDTNMEDVPLQYFVSPGAADLHLTDLASGAIDQAVSDPGAGLDIDGEPHNTGAGPDLGADEVTPMK